MPSIKTGEASVIKHQLWQSSPENTNHPVNLLFITLICHVLTSTLLKFSVRLGLRSLDDLLLTVLAFVTSWRSF